MNNAKSIIRGDIESIKGKINTKHIEIKNLEESFIKLIRQVSNRQRLPPSIYTQLNWTAKRYRELADLIVTKGRLEEDISYINNNLPPKHQNVSNFSTKRIMCMLKERNSFLLEYQNKKYIKVLWSCGHISIIAMETLKTKAGSVCVKCTKEKKDGERKTRTQDLLEKYGCEFLSFDERDTERIVYKCFCGRVYTILLQSFRSRKEKRCKFCADTKPYGNKLHINLKKSATELGLPIHKVRELLRRAKDTNIITSKKEVENVTFN